VGVDGAPDQIRRKPAGPPLTYPLTALGVVKRVYTNLAILDVTSDGFIVRDMVEGLTLDALQKVTDAPLHEPSH
jgi:3-oxoadipate CoA-transferase beta subunit